MAAVVCSLGILLLVPCAVSEKFSLSGSPHPVVGVVGQDVVLPCQLSPPNQVPRMHVWWRKIGSGFIPVHEYSDEGTKNQPGERYQNRTELFPQEFISGNISLKLKWLQVTDNGRYQCFVKNPEWSREATIELRVAAVAPVLVEVLGPRGQGIGLTCRSSGWFPKPELQWVRKNQQNLVMESVTNMTQDRENLYSAVSHVIVTEGEDTGDIGCIVRNGQLELELQSVIHLSGDVFPQVSPWLAAFWALFALDIIVAGVCAYLGYTAKRKASKKKQSKEETLLMCETVRKALESDRQELCERLDKSVTELEFRQARSYLVPVTLDPSYKHPDLSLAADGRTVQHKPLHPGPSDPSGALIAVGKEEFVASSDHGGLSGVCRWYWEVEVGDSLDWELGVLSESVRSRLRHKGLERVPKEGCWSMGRSGGRYHPSEANTVIQNLDVKLTVVGVFLDLKVWSLLFYCVNSMSLILEIPVEGSERLFLFLSPGHTAGQDQGNPLSICPPSDWDFPQKLSYWAESSNNLMPPTQGCCNRRNIQRL